MGVGRQMSMFDVGLQIPANTRCRPPISTPLSPRLSPANDPFSVLSYGFLPHIFCRFDLHLLRCCVSETTSPFSVTTSTSFAKVSQATSAGPKHKSSLTPVIAWCSPTIAFLSFCKAPRSPSLSDRAHIAPSSSQDSCPYRQGCAATFPNGDAVNFNLVQRIEQDPQRM